MRNVAPNEQLPPAELSSSAQATSVDEALGLLNHSRREIDHALAGCQELSNISDADKLLIDESLERIYKTGQGIVSLANQEVPVPSVPSLPTQRTLITGTKERGIITDLCEIGRDINYAMPMEVTVWGPRGNHTIYLPHIFDATTENRADFVGLLSELPDQAVTYAVAEKVLSHGGLEKFLKALKNPKIPMSILNRYIHHMDGPSYRLQRKVLYIEAPPELPDSEAFTRADPTTPIGISNDPSLQPDRRIYLPDGLLECGGVRVSLKPFIYRERYLLAKMAEHPGTVWDKKDIIAAARALYTKSLARKSFVTRFLKRLATLREEVDETDLTPTSIFNVLHIVPDPRPVPSYLGGPRQLYVFARDSRTANLCVSEYLATHNRERKS